MVDMRKRLRRGVAEERILETLRSARSDYRRALTLAQLREQTALSRGTVQEVIARLRRAGQIETYRECERAAGPKLLWVALTDPTSRRA